MKNIIKFSIVLPLLLILTSNNIQAQESVHKSKLRVHDPVMIQEGDKYYLFCTGWGISMYSSDDMEQWKDEGRVFQSPPEWTNEVVPGFRGHMWAPDITYHDGLFYLYYSVSAFAKNTSAIGVATSPTLNTSDSLYKWTDHGIVVQSVPNRDLWNAIDPNIIVDKEGYPWMSFGSFWEGLKMVKLIPNRTAIAQPETWITIAKRARTDFLDDKEPGDAALEAPFIFKKDSLYYLFVSWDYCCRGKESTYKIVVGRSDNVKGPYFDKDGKSMNEGGGSLVLEGNERWAGVGHNSAYTFDDKDYLIFHGYDLNEDGQPKLIITEMNWDNEGWPVIPDDALEGK